MRQTITFTKEELIQYTDLLMKQMIMTYYNLIVHNNDFEKVNEALTTSTYAKYMTNEALSIMDDANGHIDFFIQTYFHNKVNIRGEVGVPIFGNIKRCVAQGFCYMVTDKDNKCYDALSFKPTTEEYIKLKGDGYTVYYTSLTSDHMHIYKPTQEEIDEYSKKLKTKKKAGKKK